MLPTRQGLLVWPEQRDPAIVMLKWVFGTHSAITLLRNLTKITMLFVLLISLSTHTKTLPCPALHPLPPQLGGDRDIVSLWQEGASWKRVKLKH